MKIIKITLFALLITIQVTVISLAKEKVREQQEPFICSIYAQSPMMLANIMPLDENSLSSSANINATDKLVSPNNSWYYIDKSLVSVKLSPRDLLAMIEQYGLIDIHRAVHDVQALNTPLHPLVDTLFWCLARYYQSNSYLGNRDSNQKASAGWFGGISMNTLLMLHHLAEIHENLSPESKIKALGIGVGGAFFESLFDAVGIRIMAMDVQDDRVRGDFMHTVFSMGMKKEPALDQEKTIKVRDYSDVERRKIENSFFMPVKIYQQKTEAHYTTIIDNIFHGADWANTVLVFSWPRKFANDYIRRFIKSGGKTLLFVRNQAVDSIFDDVYLGSSPISDFLGKAFRNTSLELNTATRSVIDLYCRGERHPIEDALQRTSDYLSSNGF